MNEPVIFTQSVESLFVHALGGRLDATVREELRRLGLDLDRPLLPAYPVRTWEAALVLAGRTLFPQVTPAEARFELGRLMIAHYDDTVLGKAVVAMGRLIGPRRTLERMTRNIRTSNNYVQSTLEELPGGELRMTSSVLPEFRTQLPDMAWEHSGAFTRGLVTGILDKLGVEGYQVTALPTSERFMEFCRIRLPA
jgi:uncharacterized protein (TIGR02265 family)